MFGADDLAGASRVYVFEWVHERRLQTGHLHLTLWGQGKDRGSQSTGRELWVGFSGDEIMSTEQL